MNRFLMQISWIDAKVVYDTLTSVQNALQYSKKETEILLLLNEQTFIDEPLEGQPSDMWRHFINHPLIEKCNVKKVTNNDPFLGAANSRRDNIIKGGLTYWGESDCLVPLEMFYVAEEFHELNKVRPYVMTFSTRKMWPSWELVEHKDFRGKMLEEFNKDIPEQAFLRCDGPMSLQQLYDFNEKQGSPEIIQLPRARIEGAMTILSEGMPEPLICPDIDFYHEDYSLELAMHHYRIPQFHVQNILKGHDMHNPNKRSNLKDVKTHSPEGQRRRDLCRDKLLEYTQNLYQGKYAK